MPNDRAARALTGLALAVALAPGAPRAETPLSAIDWLSQSATLPRGAVVAGAPPGSMDEPAVTRDARPGDVAVSVLGGPSLDAVGLLSPQTTGLPRDLWGMGLTREIVAAIAADRPEPLPALNALVITLLLAEAEPPADSDGTGTLLLARIDQLLAMGALDAAASLLAASGAETLDLFRRSFDVALLSGSEDRACEKMRAAPDLAPTFPARIFCLARAGDWNAAALTLRTAQALGHVSPEEDALLSRFLDPDLYEGEPPLPPPARPTPLVWRMFEAVGEPLPTQGLPLAFSHADLGIRAGWKAQVEAAERLARAGVIAPNLLLGIWTERKPAASGGAWDRVAALQDMEAAFRSGEAARVARALPPAWRAMAEAGLEVPFAQIFAADLERVPPGDAAGALAFRILLLSDRAEAAARARAPRDAEEAFLIGVATGDLRGTTPPDAMARAVAEGFARPALSEQMTALLDQRRVGEVLLAAVDRIGTGTQGDLRGVTEGLAALRRLSLEGTARRTALQLLLLDRRG